MRSSRAIVAACLFATLLSGCVRQESAPAPRVVSLTPGATRALLVLELARFIVAADAASRPWLDVPVPEASLETARRHDPDLVLLGARGTYDEYAAEALRTQGIHVIEFAPHQLDEVVYLYRELASLLGDARHGHDIAHRIGDPLAEIAVRQHGRPRPRVAVVVEIDPLTLAGGHSFETDLVEIAGGESLTHGGEDAREIRSATDIAAAGPDLVIVATAAPVPPRARAHLTTRFAPLPVVFDTLDTDALWLGDGRATAEAWVAHVAAARDQLSRTMP